MPFFFFLKCLDGNFNYWTSLESLICYNYGLTFCRLEKDLLFTKLCPSTAFQYLVICIFSAQSKFNTITWMDTSTLTNSWSHAQTVHCPCISPAALTLMFWPALNGWTYNILTPHDMLNWVNFSKPFKNCNTKIDQAESTLVRLLQKPTNLPSPSLYTCQCKPHIREQHMASFFVEVKFF